jgi:hypothetical protein
VKPFRAGQLDRASELAQRAHGLAVKHEEHGNRAWVLRLLGELCFHGDEQGIERAETYYREALDQACGLGMRPLQAHCHLSLSRLNIRAARMQEARSMAALSCDLFRQMDMKLWLSEAEGLLNQLQASPHNKP